MVGCLLEAENAAWQTRTSLRSDGPPPQPRRDEMKACRHPAQNTASLLEVERQILSIIEEVHEMVGDGNEATI